MFVAILDASDLLQSMMLLYPVNPWWRPGAERSALVYGEELALRFRMGMGVHLLCYWCLRPRGTLLFFPLCVY